MAAESAMNNEMPQPFDDLVPLADKFGGLWFEHEIKGCAANLSSDELAALREAYVAIRNSCRSQQLTDWIDQECATARERHLSRGAFVVLRLFEELGEKGAQPFSDGMVRYIRKLPPRDWSRVPAEFQFLSTLADQYGIMLYEKGWEETLASTSTEIRAQLARTGQELKKSNLLHVVQEWMSKPRQS